MGRWPAQERYAKAQALKALVDAPFPEEPRHTRAVARKLVSDYSENAATAPEDRRCPDFINGVVGMLLAQLSEREQFVLSRYLGLDGLDDNPTMKEVGRELGVSGTRVQQILHKGLRRLRHPAVLLKLGELRQYILPERARLRLLDEAREEREYEAQQAREEQQRKTASRTASNGAWWRYSDGSWVAGPPMRGAMKVV